jgi:HEAT repeat protein
MKDEDRNVRWHAVRAVGNLKNVDSQTLQLSRELLHDKDTMVILNACYAMIRHDIETEQAWGVLNKSLESNELTDLLPPLMVLKELGSAAGKYQEQLIKRVNDKDDVVQLIAISVLGEIQPSKERALPVLENKLKMTQDFSVWRITKRTILKIQKSADRKRS